jgi:hypothetical protein
MPACWSARHCNAAALHLEDYHIIYEIHGTYLLVLVAHHREVYR